jgi:hypothetical protein
MSDWTTDIESVLEQISNQQFIIATPNSLELNMGQDFILNGSNIQSGSSGSNSG